MSEVVKYVQMKSTDELWVNKIKSSVNYSNLERESRERRMKSSRMEIQ